MKDQTDPENLAEDYRWTQVKDMGIKIGDIICVSSSGGGRSKPRSLIYYVVRDRDADMFKVDKYDSRRHKTRTNLLPSYIHMNSNMPLVKVIRDETEIAMTWLSLL